MDGFIKLMSAAGNGFLRLIGTFTWPIAFVAAAGLSVLLLAMYWGGAFTPARTIEQVRQETVYAVTQEQREYVAAAMIRDAIVTNEPIRVQEGVAWAVINYSRTYGVDIPVVVSRSLTMIPLGYERSSDPWFVLGYVRRVDANTATWNAALASGSAAHARTRGAQRSIACVRHALHPQAPANAFGSTGGDRPDRARNA
jgi:hypothetical protein